MTVSEQGISIVILIDMGNLGGSITKMADEELKEKVLEWFRKKSVGEKKKYYLKDVV